MTAVYVLGTVLLLLWLLSLVRVGGEVEYSGEGLRVWVRAGPLRIGVFPLRKKRKGASAGKKQAKKAPARPGTEKKEKPGGSFALFRRLLPVLLDGAGQLRRKVLVRPLELRLTIPGSADPAACALRYGQANAVLGGLWALLNQAVRLEDGTASIRADFDVSEYTVYARAGVSLTVGQGAVLGLRMGAGLLRALTETKREQNKNRKAA